MQNKAASDHVQIESKVNFFESSSSSIMKGEIEEVNMRAHMNSSTYITICIRFVPVYLLLSGLRGSIQLQKIASLTSEASSNSFYATQSN